MSHKNCGLFVNDELEIYDLFFVRINFASKMQSRLVRKLSRKKASSLKASYGPGKRKLSKSFSVSYVIIISPVVCYFGMLEYCL